MKDYYLVRLWQKEKNVRFPKTFWFLLVYDINISSLEVAGKAINQRDGKVVKLLCRPFFSWRKIHKHFEATTFKDDVNVYLPEIVLKLTLKSFFHCPSYLSEAWKTSNSNDFSKPKAFILNILELIRILLCLELFHYIYIGGHTSS